MKVTKMPKVLTTTKKTVAKKLKKNVATKSKVEDELKKVAKKPLVKKSKKVVGTKGKDKVVQKKKKKTQMPDIEGLREIDPEFYDFLKKNDKELLEFNVFDSEDDFDDEVKPAKPEESDVDDDNDDEDEEKFHKPTEQLEVASDESDFEVDEEDEQIESTKGAQKVTLNLLRQWQAQLEAPNVPIDIIRKVVQALNAALASIAAENAEAGAVNNAPFKVSGTAVFDGIVSLCVLHLQPAIWRTLGIKPNSKQPLHKSKKWVKLRSCLRYYLTDLTQLLQQISSPNILSVLLKHLHQMAPVVACFSQLGKTLLKRCITLWSTDDETVRVVAFLCILKITRNQQVSFY